MNGNTGIEVTAIRYFVAGAKVLEPRFEEINKLMTDYWKQFPLEVAEPIAKMLERVIQVFKGAEGAELENGDGELMIAYYIMCRCKVYEA